MIVLTFDELEAVTLGAMDIDGVIGAATVNLNDGQLITFHPSGHPVNVKQNLADDVVSMFEGETVLRIEQMWRNEGRGRMFGRSKNEIFWRGTPDHFLHYAARLPHEHQVAAVVIIDAKDRPNRALNRVAAFLNAQAADSPSHADLLVTKEDRDEEV